MKDFGTFFESWLCRSTAEYFFNHFYIYLYVYALFWAPPHPASRQNLFCPLVLQFCWRKNIKDNKKDMAFLLVWDKDSYIVWFPCICVLQPKLVHQYQTSLLLPSPLPIVASVSLRLLYSFLYSEHIHHTQHFWFPSLALSLLCVVSL
jgi:hypothetical protein